MKFRFNKLLLTAALFAASALTVVSSDAEAQSQSDKAEAQILAKELIDIYNNTVQSDSSLEALINNKGVTHVSCVKDFDASARTMVGLWKTEYLSLKGKGDKNAAYDAALHYVPTYRNITAAYQRCENMPLHKIQSGIITVAPISPTASPQ